MDARTAATLACRLLALYFLANLSISLPGIAAASLLPLSLADTPISGSMLFTLALFALGILVQVAVIFTLWRGASYLASRLVSALS